MAHRDPLAYLITFTTYGSWLHGDHRSSVNRWHASFGTPNVAPSPRLESLKRARMRDRTVRLDRRGRSIIGRTLHEVAEHRGWRLWAFHVRPVHLHVVVSAPTRPELVMNAMKSWLTRRLVDDGIVARGPRVWTRHGSTRYLWDEESVAAAVHYVVVDQGTPMEVWSA